MDDKVVVSLWWNKEVFGWFDLRVEKVFSDLNDMDTLILRPPHQRGKQDILKKRKEASSMVWKNLQFKESLLRQKFMKKWIQEGDLNTVYFHSIMQERRR